jgi:hypothetical protein
MAGKFHNSCLASHDTGQTENKRIMIKFDNVPIYKRFDENGYFVLDDGYIMSYSHRDGFSERLLSIDVLIDQNFELTMYHQCFKLGNEYQKTERDFQFKLTVKKNPLEVSLFLEKIIFKEDIILKNYYGFDGVSMDDNPEQLYLFAGNKKTKSISINGLIPLTEEFFSTSSEKEFLKFHVFIKNWTNSIYDKYVQNYSR